MFIVMDTRHRVVVRHTDIGIHLSSSVSTICNSVEQARELRDAAMRTWEQEGMRFKIMNLLNGQYVD